MTLSRRLKLSKNIGSLQVYVDDEIKNKSSTIHDAFDLDLSTVVRLYFKLYISINAAWNGSPIKNRYQ